MQLKNVSRRTPLVTILLGFFVLSSAFLIYFILDISIHQGLAPTTEGALILPKPEEAITELPVRLKIPKINVDAPIEYVGLASDGAMDVPKERANTAWFNLGPRPGDDGSAVIAGHYGQKDGKASVFDNLYKLRKGDKLYIEDKKGVIVTFVVRENRRYDPNADASVVFGLLDGKPHLNLVTCEGGWDEVSKTYSKRLVVFTDKE